jgi:Tfp pilus assembly PilM family ATPase
MVSFFPFRRPGVGIAFSADSISLVELTARWPGRRAVRRAITEPIPNGLLVPNPDRRNVTDAVKFGEILRKLLKVTRRRTTAVSLPISCAHIGIFAFDQLSPRAEDRLAVLRWRFQHDEHMDVREATIVHRVFHGQNVNGPTYVLAVAVKRQILEQYEDILEKAGLIGVSIGWSTLQLFDMGRPLLERAGEVFLVHADSQALTVLAVRDGVPIFIRRKLGPIRDTPKELSRTLQYYDDLYPHHPADQTVRASLLYQFREPQDQRSGGPSDGEMLRPVSGSSWQIQLMPPAWMCPIRPINMVNGMTEWAALASLCTV